MFLEGVVKHHEGAVEMAQTDAIKLAEAIVTSQQREITVRKRSAHPALSTPGRRPEPPGRVSTPPPPAAPPGAHGIDETSPMSLTE
jgi:hypothetical protein